MTLPPPDLRHPTWCDPNHCTMLEDPLNGRHFSVPVRMADPLHSEGDRTEQEVELFLSKWADEPLDAPDVYLNLRFTRGPVESLETYRLELASAEHLAALIVEAAGRAKSGEVRS